MPADARGSDAIPRERRADRAFHRAANFRRDRNQRFNISMAQRHLRRDTREMRDLMCGIMVEQEQNAGHEKSHRITPRRLGQLSPTGKVLMR